MSESKNFVADRQHSAIAVHDDIADYELSPERFSLGRLVATPNALASLTELDIRTALSRHIRGDWGEVDAEDRESNDLALIEGMRLLSAYLGSNGTRFWIITEWDRSVTTVLLPEDY